MKAGEDISSHLGNTAAAPHSSGEGGRKETRREAESRDGSRHHDEAPKLETRGRGKNGSEPLPCGYINVTFIYSETLFSKELLVHERGGGGNKVNYIS